MHSLSSGTSHALSAPVTSLAVSAKEPEEHCSQFLFQQYNGIADNYIQYHYIHINFPIVHEYSRMLEQRLPNVIMPITEMILNHEYDIYKVFSSSLK